jgi:predicted nucleic acid-binding protein
LISSNVSGKPAHDARLVAAMIKHGIVHLLTFNDGDFKRYTEIVAESPLALQSP